MRGASPVNDEFEVGFDQCFEAHWRYAEFAGRGMMILFVGCALFGLLGRGPYSHATCQAADSVMMVDYEPVSRHTTSTILTVHIKAPSDGSSEAKLLIGQQMVEPLGYQHATPQPDRSSITDAGDWLYWNMPAEQQDVLIK